MGESQFEEDLYKLRQEKLRQIGELGKKNGLSEAAATYPNSYAVSAPGWDERQGDVVAWLKQRYDSADSAPSAEQLAAAEHIEVSIAGRVMAIRVQGKAGFAQLQQGGLRMQIYVRKDDVGEDAFAMYKLLDLGDHIGVKGYLMRTRTGELTVHVSTLTFLAKAMLALPDKYHGLEDTELRYRQRYLDLFMNTGHAAKAAEGEEAEAAINVREVFIKRAAVLRAIRRFFDERGYLEVETPMLHTIAGGAAARPFKTHHNALDIPLSLRIAPELYLKRLVVGGLDRVYEINRNFRNEGVSTKHNPEFTMLEFYQAYANYHDLMDLTKELVSVIANEVNGMTKTLFNGEQIELAPDNWIKLSMIEAIIRFWPEHFGPKPTKEILNDKNSFTHLIGWAIQHATNDPVVKSWLETYPNGDWLRVANKPGLLGGLGPLVMAPLTGVLGILASLVDGAPHGKCIAMLFETVGENPLEKHLIQPTIIYDFPLAVSPLSKVKPDEPDWVERFEFYIGGFEVGNAFSELNDPEDQRRRFEAQVADKDPESMASVDEDYVRALGYGLPPTAGEGIGIDRLTMVLTGAKSIRDVILFPLMRPVGKVE